MADAGQRDGRREGDRRDRHRSRSRERRRSRSRERRRSRSRERGGREYYDRRREEGAPPREGGPPPPRPARERKTGFDLGPSGEVAAPVPIMALTGMLLPGMPQLMGAPLMASSMTQQATRHARRIYLGGLPPTVEEQSLAALFNQAMNSVGAVNNPDCVQNVFINSEKKFAFVEFKTVEECSNAMALDGIMFDGVPIRVRRPNDYNPVAAAALGPSHPSASLNLGVLGLAPALAGGDADRIFVGGLPGVLGEAQVRELLEAFGPLRQLELVREPSGASVAFCAYADGGVTDAACTGLNGMAMGGQALTVRRATAMDAALALPPPPPPLPPTSPVLVLDNVVSEEELRDDAELADILEDMREECGKYGAVLALRIPRPAAEGEPRPAGLGRCYVQYAAPEEAARARQALHGRKFAGNPVVAEYHELARFEAGDL